MSKVKKILAMVLSLAMIMGMSVTTFAANDAAIITINNAAAGAKFKTVQVVEAANNKDTGWKFVDGFAQYFTAATAFNTTDEQAIIKGMIYDKDATAKEGAKIDGFAAKYAAALSNIQAIYKESDATAGNTITVSNAGLYVIAGFETGDTTVTYSPMAVFVGMDYASGKPAGVLTPEAINAKKSTTHVEKASDDEDKAVEIGKEVTYTVDSIVPYVPTTKTNRYYKFIDEIKDAEYVLASGKLTVNVVVKDSKGAESNLFSKSYTVTPTDFSEDGEVVGQTFTLDLTDDVLDTNNYANKYIELSYKAKVTDMEVGNTVYAGDGTTDGKGLYGSDDDKLISGQVTLTKVNGEGVKFGGAEFIVKKTVNGVTTYATFDDNNNLTGWVASDIGATRITTSSTEGETLGTVTVSGLEKGVPYEFVEKKAPAGYSINETNATVTWGDVPQDLDTPVLGTTSMTDTKLSALPSTGGMGTTLFTIGGCVIMILAAAAFFFSRKKSKQQ